MAGTFIIGEQKVRPGSYFNIGKNGGNAAADVINGVTAVVFKADFGPINKAVELSAEDGYASVYGTALTTDAIQQAINGGAKTIIACRVGNGGSEASISLNDKEGNEAVHISARYPGDKEFSVTIRQKITDDKVKQAVFYTGTKEFEKVEFASGAGEAEAFADAMKSSNNFIVSIAEGKEQSELSNVLQCAFTKGENPTVTAEDYSNAFAEIEPFEFNTICLDTEDPAIHLLLHAFVNRIFDSGSLVQAVIAEKRSVDLETRQAHAASFNDEKMNYVLNANVSEQDSEIDGYQTAARIAGMIAACSSNKSLTHTVVTGFNETLERLTNTQIIKAEQRGCIVLTMNSKKQVWIDSAINTLITPSDEKDDGWKKIRRVKTRFELIRRINITTDNLIGKVDNDQNGRATIISQVKDVGIAMVDEGKLISCNVTESELYKSDADSAWFCIDVIDKDSAEHIYTMFKFQFSTNEE